MMKELKKPAIEAAGSAASRIFLVLVLLLIISLNHPLYAQNPDIRQIGPGLYAAGIPSDDFEFRTAPQSGGRQRQMNWCWAASIQMVLNYHGISVTQEEIVARVFGRLVDAPADAQTVLSALSGWGVTSNGTPVLISASPIVLQGSDIVSDLAYHQPLIVGFMTDGGISHACVLTAVSYTVNPYDNQPIFQGAVIRDPWPGRQSRVEMSWAEFSGRLMFIARVRVTPVREQ
jgi:hypothetical protein